MNEVYRKVLVALVKSQLRKKLESLAEVVGPEFEGIDTKDPVIRTVVLECIGLAFYELHNELTQKI